MAHHELCRNDEPFIFLLNFGLFFFIDSANYFAIATQINRPKKEKKIIAGSAESEMLSIIYIFKF
jgi:hypothetical protein